MSRRVGVNLLWMVPDVVGGSEEYTTRLLQGLSERIPGDLELVLFTLPSFAARYPDLAAAHRTVVARIDGTSKALRVAAEATWLLRAAQREGVDVVHHAGGTIPVVRATPSIVTIHDLQPLLVPGNFASLKQLYLRWRLPPSARASRFVITLTEFTKRTIVERLDVPEERVVLVPPGYTPAIVEEPEHDPRLAYRIDGPFFVFPAITYPHKNHLLAIRALARVLRQRPDVLLVLSSGEAQMEAAVAEEAERLGVSANVRRIGRVPRGDLDWLLRNAAGLVFPSRFEGFGLPVLEAMGNGCPVIAADATALTEVVGQAGILLDPTDPEPWATAMLRLLDDESLRSWLVEAGLARLATYRWATSADALVAAYERALEPSR